MTEQQRLRQLEQDSDVDWSRYDKFVQSVMAQTMSLKENNVRGGHELHSTAARNAKAASARLQQTPKTRRLSLPSGPRANAAATQIQARFKGHHVRTHPLRYRYAASRGRKRSGKPKQHRKATGPPDVRAATVTADKSKAAAPSMPVTEETAVLRSSAARVETAPMRAPEEPSAAPGGTKAAATSEAAAPKPKLATPAPVTAKVEHPKAARESEAAGTAPQEEAHAATSIQKTWRGRKARKRVFRKAEKRRLRRQSQEKVSQMRVMKVAMAEVALRRARKGVHRLEADDIAAWMSVEEAPPEAAFVAICVCTLVGAPTTVAAFNSILLSKKKRRAIRKLEPSRIENSRIKMVATVLTTNEVWGNFGAHTHLEAMRALILWCGAVVGNDDCVTALLHSAHKHEDGEGGGGDGGGDEGTGSPAKSDADMMTTFDTTTGTKTTATGTGTLVSMFNPGSPIKASTVQSAGRSPQQFGADARATSIDEGPMSGANERKDPEP